MMDGQEPEKRENPYKKQSPYKKQKVSREELPPEEQTAGKTETFLTANVKLITFLTFVVVFLVFLGPVSIWQISEWVQAEKQEALEESYIPMDALLIIADKGTDAHWRDFRSFGKSETVAEADGFVTWRLEVKDEPFAVVIGGPSKSLNPQYIRVYCLKTGDSADLYKDDIAAFIEAHQNMEE